MALWAAAALAAAQTAPNELEVKFRTGPTVRLRAGAPRDLATGRALVQTNDPALVGAVWARSFPSTSERRLEAMRARTAAQRKNAPDLNLYYRVRFPGGAIRRRRAALRKWPELRRSSAAVPTCMTAPLSPRNARNGAHVMRPRTAGMRAPWANGRRAGIAICTSNTLERKHVDLPPVTIWATTRIPYGDDTDRVSATGGSPTAPRSAIARGPSISQGFADGSYNLAMRFGRGVDARAPRWSAGDRSDHGTERH
jgi:hypothetical protein